MPTNYSWVDVPDWSHVPVSGHHLSMALTGFNESGCVTITWQNHVAIADYIHENLPLRDKGGNGKMLSREAHIRLMRQCVGFKRTYMG